jgi:two-component system nitrate/nitrite response regulator NarL
MTTPIRLLVVDDHTLFRRGLVALLASDPTLQVIGEAGDAPEAVRRAGKLQPDVVLLDNHLPGATGVQSLSGLREAAPRTRIVLLTVSEDEQDLQAALRGGASGYLLKTIEGDELSRAVHRVVHGEPVVSSEMTGKLVSAFQQGDRRSAPAADPIAQLTARERQVLEEIARGASNKEIARTLSIAETTVKIHVQNILRKLGMTSRVQAAVAARQARPAAASGHAHRV